jgi:hypothetical protein
MIVSIHHNAIFALKNNQIKSLKLLETDSAKIKEVAYYFRLNEIKRATRLSLTGMLPLWCLVWLEILPSVARLYRKSPSAHVLPHRRSPMVRSSKHQ